MGKRFFIVLLFIVSLSFPAFGSGFPDTYGVGLRAIALGGAFTAVADDYSAAFYNPAGLAQSTGNHFNLEYLYTSPDIDVKKLNGQDLIIPSASGGVRNDPTNYRGGNGLDLQIPMIGLALDVNGILDLPANVQLGIAISMTEQMDTMYRIYSFPPDQPHFFRYGNDISRVFIAASVGVEVISNLIYVGGGVQAMLYGDGQIWIDGLSIGTGPEYENVVGQAKISSLMHYDPVVGILITPFDKKLKIGLSYRAEEKVEIDPLPTLVATDLGGIGLAMVMGMGSFFTPEEYSAGIALDLGRFMVSIEANKQMWSEYDYTNGEKYHYYSGNPELTGIETGTPDFDDTLNYRIGMEYKIGKDASVMAGYCHQPTPIPDQSGRVSNYLDMDKDIFSIGGKYTFKTSMMVKPVTIAAAFQYQMLDDYTAYKNGVQGKSWVDQESYKVEGDVYAGGISVGLAW